MKELIDKVNAANGDSGANVLCNDSDEIWAAAAQLVVNTNTYFCADSTGLITTITGKVGATGGTNFSTSALSCPR